MSLVRGDDALDVLDRGGKLECPGCGELYSSEAEDALCDDFGDVACPSAGCGWESFIPREPGRFKIAEKFPGDLGEHFVPVPTALLKDGDALQLDAFDRMIVIALESHRFAIGDEVFPSIERIAHLSGMSPATAKRRLTALADRGFLARRPGRGYAGRWTATRYSLEGFWQALDDAVVAKRTRGGSE